MLTMLPGVDCSPDEFEGAITGSGFPARPDDSQRMDMLASISAVRLQNDGRMHSIEDTA